MAERAQLEYPLDAESFGTLKITMPDVLKELARSQAITLVSGDVTFDVRNTDVMNVSASGAVTIATITNGFDGQVLTLIFNDTNVTITDDSGGATATVNLTTSFVSADGTVIQLVHNGTSWEEIGRSVGGIGGPGSSTDNAIVRWDGTGGTEIQNSVVTIADTTGNMAGVGTLNTHTIPSGTSTFAIFIDNLSVFGATTSLRLLGVISDETGSGALVFANTPTLVTPVIGAATGTSLVLTGNLSAEDLLIEDSDASHFLTITTTSNLTAARTLTLVPGDSSRTVTISGNPTLTTGTMAVTGTSLAQFAATTSAQLAGVISNETGSGLLVFNTSPTLTTPRFANSGFIADSNGNELLVFGFGADAANHFGIESAAAGSGPLLSALGSDTDISIGFQAKGAGDYFFLGKSGESAVLVLREDTANGTNAIGLTVADALGADFVLTLPSATDTLVGKATTDTFTGKSIDLTSNTLVGSVAEFNTALESADFYTTGGTDVAVADGGTGASSLTDGGVILGSGTGAVTVLGQATDGQLVIGDTSADPVLATLTAGAGVTITNAAGSITVAAGNKISIVVTDVTVTNTITETNIISVSIPAGTLGTANGVRTRVFISDFKQSTTAGTLNIRLKYGSTEIINLTVNQSSTVDTGYKGYIDIILVADGATNAQEGSMFVHFVTSPGDNFVAADIEERVFAGNGTAAEDSTNALNFIVSVEWSEAATADSITMLHATIESVV